MASGKQVVNVEQQEYFKSAHGQHSNIDGVQPDDKYVYKVLTLKNRTIPAVGTIICHTDLQAIIDGGTEVNIQPQK